MTVREQIIKEVVTLNDDQLLADILQFLAQRRGIADRPRVGSFAAFEALEGTLSSAEADEMQGIIDREFSTPEGEW